MDFRTSLLAFVLVLTNLPILILAQDFWCYENGNYTTNSTYHNNLNDLLSSLPSKIGDSGFCNVSLGQGADRVNAIAFCRADTQLEACRSCVKKAAADIVKNCTNRKQASKWNHPCLVRYSNGTVLGNREDGRHLILYNTGKAPNEGVFNANLSSLLNNLVPQAASGGPMMKVAAGNISGPDFQTIYALLQCTPDLSQEECTNCLMKSQGKIASCCLSARGFYCIVPSCYFQYEVESFYNITRIQEAQRMLSIMPSPPLLPPPIPRVPQPPGKAGNNTARTVVIIVVPLVLALISVACFGVWLKKITNKKSEETIGLAESTESEISTAESLQYDFNKLREATNNFSDANKLGQGGFGPVYKGALQNGELIAVKRLLKGSTQGDLEFQNEVMLLIKLQHRNLVRLIGFAHEGIERILIYEYIENSSLDHFIFDPAKAHSINWNTRFKIIFGIAKGLLYLHEDSRLRVIHRDLKPSNILLDASMNPKIADFGMARLFEHDEDHISTQKIAGTYGYMSPEYALYGHFSIKSDVFSFGVLVLEIISGQRNNSIRMGDTTIEEGLLSFVWRNWCDATITNVIDPSLLSTHDCSPEIIKCIQIALLCIQENVIARPTTASIVLMLSSSTITFSRPLKPAFLASDTTRLNTSTCHEITDSRDFESSTTSKAVLAQTTLPNDDGSITELHPR